MLDRSLGKEGRRWRSTRVVAAGWLLAVAAWLWVALVGGTSEIAGAEPVWWRGSQAEEARPRCPLDLPSGGRGIDEEQDEFPEVIVFYGAEYEGDAFFWCLDKSYSMTAGDRMSRLKREVIEAIVSLSSQAEFGLVSFSYTWDEWRSVPELATVANKISARSWVNALQPLSSTCLSAAAQRTLLLAQQSSHQDRVVIVVGDGLPICNGAAVADLTLLEVTAANTEQIPIHTLYVSEDDEGIEFMQQLAEMNGGEFRHAP